MNRETAKEIFLKMIQQLPNRSQYRKGKNTDLKIDFEKVEKILEGEPLKLVAADIPKKLWFQCILGQAITTTQKLGGNIYYVDEYFWNLEDEATKEKIRKIKKVFLFFGHHQDLTLLQQDTILKYAKSRFPNFYKI